MVEYLSSSLANSTSCASRTYNTACMQRINLKFVERSSTRANTGLHVTSCSHHLPTERMIYPEQSTWQTVLLKEHKNAFVECMVCEFVYPQRGRRLRDCEQVWAKPSFYLPHMLIAGVAAGGKAVTVRELLTTICIVRHLPRVRQSRFIERVQFFVWSCWLLSDAST